jgi:hypothetical protein
MDSISRLLKPRSVAVIGASADASKTAGRPVPYLVKHGFPGHLSDQPEGGSHRRSGLLQGRGVAAAAPDVLGRPLGGNALTWRCANWPPAACRSDRAGQWLPETGEEGARRQSSSWRQPARCILGPNTIGLST